MTGFPVEHSDSNPAFGYLGMGLDRMVVEIGDTIKVIPPRNLDGLPDLDKNESHQSSC